MSGAGKGAFLDIYERKKNRRGQFGLALILTPVLPDEFRTNLTNTGITRTRDIAEVSVADVPGRVVELSVIEDIEEFTPNLEMHRFGDRNDLRYAQVRVIKPRSVEEP